MRWAASSALIFDVDILLAADDEQAATLAHVAFEIVLASVGNVLDVPIVEYDDLIIGQLRRIEARGAGDFELRGLQRLR